MVILDLVTCLRGIWYDCVVIFYPENSIYVSPFILKQFQVKIVYVVHLDDFYWFEWNDSIFLRLKRWNMKFVDHFIVLSANQLRSFSVRFPGKVTLIPHGVWCDELPNERATPSPSIVIVGKNYRDYEFMNAVIARCHDILPEIVFDLVGVDGTKLQLESRGSNVRLHGRLSSQSYRALLRNCQCVFLPLTFATANNALLEGLSLGVPVLCSDVSGVRDYICDKSYLVHDVEEVVNFVLCRRLMSADEHIAEASKLLEHCKANFSWPIIRARVAAVVKMACAE